MGAPVCGEGAVGVYHMEIQKEELCAPGRPTLVWTCGPSSKDGASGSRRVGSCERACAGRASAVYVSVPGRKCVHEGVGRPLRCRWAVKVAQKQFCFLSD